MDRHSLEQQLEAAQAALAREADARRDLEERLAQAEALLRASRPPQSQPPPSRMTDEEDSARSYRFLADFIPQIVWMARRDGGIEYFNRRWFEYTGMTLQQTEGWAWKDVVHPDDVASCFGAWRASVRTGEPVETHCRLRRAEDGAHRWHLVRAVPMRDDRGKIVRWFGTCTDIDDGKRTEQALELLVRAGIILSASLDYRETLASLARLIVPALADGCVVHLLEEGAARVIAVAHVDPAREAALPRVDERQPLSSEGPYGPHGPLGPLSLHGSCFVLRTGEPELLSTVTEDLLRAIACDPEQLERLQSLGTVSAMTVPMSARGELIGAITFLSSESGRRYTEADLLLAVALGRRAAVAVENSRLLEVARRERQRVEEADRAKDEFLAVVSHELRTPLTAILGWSRMLGQGTLVDERKRRHAAEIIERNAHVQSRLIEDLLDLSRIMTGKLRLSVAMVPLPAVIDAALEAVRPAADAKGVLLEPQAPCPDARAVSGDPDRLQQIVWNLLSNAVKFTQAGGRVRARLRYDGASMEILVEDTGQGIAPEFLPYVFDRFRQADTGTTRSKSGLGLGLAIVRHLVELHGGSVEARSDGEERGAAFLVRLPVPPRTGRTPPRLPALPAKPALELAGLRILAVDDDADTREVLHLGLEEAGAQVTLASSAAEALRLVPDLLPDVIIADVAMPREDGCSLIRRLRALPASEGGRIPAIALTALARAEDRARTLLAGFDLHVPKPVVPADLIAAVAALVRGVPS